MKTEIRLENGYWSLYVDDLRTVSLESLSIVESVRDALIHPRASLPSEVAEVAETIRAGIIAREVTS